MSLGKKLAEIKAIAAAEKEQATLRAEREKSEKAERDLATVARFFSDAQAQVALYIEQGKVPPRIKLGHGSAEEAAGILTLYKWNDPAFWIDKVGHPYYSVWAEFQAWAHENDLVAEWHYCWDGGGMYSWMELEVTPLG